MHWCNGTVRHASPPNDSHNVSSLNLCNLHAWQPIFNIAKTPLCQRWHVILSHSVGFILYACATLQVKSTVYFHPWFECAVSRISFHLGGRASCVEVHILHRRRVSRTTFWWQRETENILYLMAQNCNYSPLKHTWHIYTVTAVVLNSAIRLRPI